MSGEFRSKAKNPTRKECESIIKRILSVEIERRTVNTTFKKPGDFMKYFESLYLPSPALTKQVQRAVKSLNMAKDSDGYYILNKSKEQSDQDKDIKKLLVDGEYEINSLETTDMLFIKLNPDYINFVMNKLSSSISIHEYILTMFATNNGIIILTDDKENLQNLLENIIK